MCYKQIASSNLTAICNISLLKLFLKICIHRFASADWNLIASWRQTNTPSMSDCLTSNDQANKQSTGNLISIRANQHLYSVLVHFDSLYLRYSYNAVAYNGLLSMRTSATLTNEYACNFLPSNRISQKKKCNPIWIHCSLYHLASSLHYYSRAYTHTHHHSLLAHFYVSSLIYSS